MANFAGWLPLLVIAELLGVPVDQCADFRRWTNILLVPAPTIGDLAAFFTDLIAAKRRDPGSDLLSALLALPDDELTSLAFLLFVRRL